MADNFEDLKKGVLREVKILRELDSLKKDYNNSEESEKRMISGQMDLLKKNLSQTSKDVEKKLEGVGVGKKNKPKPLPKNISIPEKSPKPDAKTPSDKSAKKKKAPKKVESKEITELEKSVLSRLKKGEKKEKEKKSRGPSKYVSLSNKVFFNFSQKVSNKDFFRKMKLDLKKSNLEFLPASYISVMLFNTLISAIISFFVFIFLLFFNVGLTSPFVSVVDENIGIRFLKVVWILIGVPLAVFVFMYFYPSMEKRSLESKINHELPFATLHMAAISGSLVDPSEIFRIIMKTEEYPAIREEFSKIISQINIYGLDLVSALRNISSRSPSKKLSELLNGLATTIGSGGDLAAFFEKRSQSLLFEYKIEREKSTRSAETFMDIYISVVIAAPMILMLLLMMMKVSGLGISLSTEMIAIVMILGVSAINVLFLTLIHLKQPTE